MTWAPGSRDPGAGERGRLCRRWWPGLARSVTSKPSGLKVPAYVGLARFVRRQGLQSSRSTVATRKRRWARVTRDAEAAARSVLAGVATGSADGAAEMVRDQDRPRYGRQGPHYRDDHAQDAGQRGRVREHGRSPTNGSSTAARPSDGDIDPTASVKHPYGRSRPAGGTFGRDRPARRVARHPHQGGSADPA